MNRLGKLMTMLNPEKTQMPSAEDALPGRSEPAFDVPERHAVLDTPLQPPFPDGIEVAYFALGCFWGAERLFWGLDGVYTTAVGYMNGTTPNPTYEEVCSGKTGHAEAVLVAFDPAKISYADLLKVFFEEHDPTQGMRQGNDVGTQYRSGIYFTNDAQKATAEMAHARLRRGAARRRPRAGHDRGRARRRPSTTPRTTTSSTCTRCRTATAASPAPASPAASRPRPPSARSPGAANSIPRR